eukprot:6795014-Prorocentrum_lima.AAC.1
MCAGTSNNLFPAVQPPHVSPRRSTTLFSMTSSLSTRMLNILKWDHQQPGLQSHLYSHIIKAIGNMSSTLAL